MNNQKVTCSKCSVLFNKSEKYAGKKFICNSCRNDIQPQIKSQINSVSQDEPSNRYNTRNFEKLKLRKEYEKDRENLKNYAWEKAEKVRGYDPAKYRIDKSGNIIYKASYGKDTKMGWNVDHSKPLNEGGTNHKNNLQALQTSQNKSKGSKYPYNYDESEPRGVTRYDLIKTNVDKRSSFVKNQELLFNFDGTIDARSKAVKSGHVILRKDGHVNENSKAVKSGNVSFKKDMNNSIKKQSNSSFSGKQQPVKSTTSQSNLFSTPMPLPSQNKALNISNSKRANSVDRGKINLIASSKQFFPPSIIYNQNVHNNYSPPPSPPGNSTSQRCNNGSRDMRCKENWGHDKYDTVRTKGYSPSPSPPCSYQNVNRYSPPPSPPGNTSFHRCNDGSRDMRCKENWGHEKYDTVRTKGYSPSPSPPCSYLNANSYSPPSPPCSYQNGNNYSPSPSPTYSYHNENSYSPPPSPPGDSSFHRCNDGSRDMRYKENWGHDKYDTDD